MTIVESRVKKGTFTLGGTGGSGGTGGTAFSCQPTNIRVTPSYDDDGDAVETLCGDNISAVKKESWQLQGTAIQDFDDPEGFLSYCYENAMTTTHFVWEPNVTGAPTWEGDLYLLALEEGGDVNTRLTSDFAFDCQGKPSRTYAAPGQIATPQDHAADELDATTTSAGVAA